MDQTDREIFEGSVSRAVHDHTGAFLDRALDGLGWRDALAADESTAVGALFDGLGRANACAGALDDVLRHALGVDTPGAGVVLPPLGQWGPPGRLDGERVVIHGLGSDALSRSAEAVVVVGAAGKQLASVVPLESLRLQPVGGIDPAYGLVVVEGEGIGAGGEPVDWNGAVALGQQAIGHELNGASRMMLELAREHSLSRVQFGRTISGFQAVRHRLAETLVAVETAQAALDAAWADRSVVAAAMAKAVAGRCARSAARHCQQVLAGMGFTAEHPFHRYVRRVYLLDQLLGSADRLTAALGADLLSARKLPPVLPL